VVLFNYYLLLSINSRSRSQPIAKNLSRDDYVFSNSRLLVLCELGNWILPYP